ncbi:MAG: alpha/beta hydrolase [Bacteroidota bacterium]|nr:alpha/beta hydrolase [Bacteroidota bacterium]
MQNQFRYLDATISYRIIGEGKPVVLLHGFGETGHIWDEQIAFLKDFCCLLIPDLPGSGASSLLRQKAKVKIQKEGSGSNDILMEDYADCIQALLLHQNIESCIMLGHSMGGYITLAFAEKYPGFLSAFGLIHSTAFADTDEKKKNRERGIALIAEFGAYAFLKNTTPNLFAERFKQKCPEKINKLIEEGKAFTSEALQQYYRAMMLRPDRTHVLKGNPLPVIFVMGTEDIAAPMEDVLKQVSLPNISYIYVLPDTGHMGMWEAADELNRQLLAFIN